MFTHETGSASVQSPQSTRSPFSPRAPRRLGLGFGDYDNEKDEPQVDINGYPERLPNQCMTKHVDDMLAQFPPALQVLHEKQRFATLATAITKHRAKHARREAALQRVVPRQRLECSRVFLRRQRSGWHGKRFAEDGRHGHSKEGTQRAVTVEAKTVGRGNFSNGMDDGRPWRILFRSHRCSR